jgi:hypothetical protein
MSIEALSLAIPVRFGLLLGLRVQTAQVLPEPSIARRGLRLAKTLIERSVMAHKAEPHVDDTRCVN